MNETVSNNYLKHEFLISPNTPEPDELEDISPQERHERRMKRKKEIVRASSITIAFCVIFAAIKFFIGYLSHSISVETDAMSSLTESYSAIIAIVGIELAHRKPTAKHPNGFGRVEYITTIIGAIFVIVAGWHYLEQSISQIVKPVSSSVTNLQVFFLVLTIIGKFYLYHDDTKTGKEYNSTGLTVSGSNALLSCFESLLVIIGVYVNNWFHIDIDGWIGLIISFFILWTGIYGVKVGMTNLLGAPVKSEVAGEITKILLEEPNVIGVYDIYIIDNGAGLLRGTANVELPSDLKAEKAYEIFRNARNTVYRKLGIDMIFGLITVNYCNTDIYPLAQKIDEEILKIEGIQNLHGFYWDKEANEVDLHIIVDFNSLNDQALEDKIRDIVQKYIPNASVLIDKNVNYLENLPGNPTQACTISYKS